MRFLVGQNALKYVFGLGSAPKPAEGAHGAPPNFLVVLRESTCTEKERRGKGAKKETGEGRTGGSVKGGKVKWKGPWVIFLQGATFEVTLLLHYVPQEVMYGCDNDIYLSNLTYSAKQCRSRLHSALI